VVNDIKNVSEKWAAILGFHVAPEVGVIFELLTSAGD
jgi:hypothetical protein